ncbi:MAG: hypothetical protein AAGC78_18080 [Cellvibrio sp.]|uniref:hypothetical protein n=1 Tax=Cellvibrio sp. TaxID=1965322 RepID=UPI0031B5454E
MMGLRNRLMLILITCTLSACVVAPKKVASYDGNCMVSTQKIVLTTAQLQEFNKIKCVTNSCRAEFVEATVTSVLVTTTSAIVSGSIALVGNTLYWLESQGKCPNMQQPAEEIPKKPKEEYLLEEEIITATKS